MPSSISSSEAQALDGLVHADELAEAHRAIPERRWGPIAFASLILTLVLMTGWEVFWRHQGYLPGDIKDSNAAWAEQRRRATGDAVVLIGSSRNHYDVDLDVWQRLAGRRPVQLSLNGTSPRFMLDDLAHDPSFHGLVVADVMTPLFFGYFGGVSEDALPYARRETVAQRIGWYLSLPADRLFAYFDDQTRPRELWRRLRLPLRPGQRPAFVDPYKIGVSESDRNSRIWQREVDDAAYRERSIRIWQAMMGPGIPRPPFEPGKVVAEVAANVAAIRARGGEVVFVMHPSGGFFAASDAHFPRGPFWDALLAATHSRGVRYDDHPELQGFRFPEMSHMDPRDTPAYTARLVPLVLAAASRPVASAAP